MHCKARAPPKECGAFYLIKLVFDSALNYTTSMFTALDEALPRPQKILVELEDLSRQLYPGERFLRLTLKGT